MTNEPTADIPRPPGDTAPPGEGTTPPGEETGPPPGGPPPGAGAPPPPPFASAPPRFGFDLRYPLVRPREGRWLAGVCVGIGRATNTDPMLWRVLAAVLTLFGGVGLLLYLIAWLLTPSEGDTASPLEGLVGRGDSTTSAVTVIAVTILAAVVGVFILSDGFRVAVLGVVAVIAALLLFQRGQGRTAPVGPPPHPGGPAYPGGPAQAGAAPPDPGPPSFPDLSPAPATVPTGAFDTPAAAFPTAEAVAGPAGTAPPPAYRPPFAPHGPYPPPPPPPPAAPARSPRPPKPPKERSRLGRVVLSVMCLALGAVAVVDLTIGGVRPSTYFAVALTVVGAGLVVGAWLGRARWLIVAGVLLAGAVGIASVTENEDLEGYRQSASVTWQPVSLADLRPSYQHRCCDATLDLRGVDFAAAAGAVAVDVAVNAGELRILLPANVDADIRARVRGGGDANVLGEQWGGFDTPMRQIRDDGADGPGGGTLMLDARMNFGNLEVSR